MEDTFIRWRQNIFKNKIKRLLLIGSTDYDSQEQKLKRSSMIIVTLILGHSAVIMGIFYIYLEHYLLAAIPLSYSLVSLVNLYTFDKRKNIIVFQRIQLTLILLLPFFLMWSLGGFALGSFVFIWAFYTPIKSLIDEDPKSLYWLYAFFFLVAISILLEQNYMPEYLVYFPHLVVTFFYFVNIMAGLSGIFFLIRYFILEKNINSNKLQYLASYDSLTGLANRSLLRENLTKMIALAKRQKHTVGFLFLDLDGFKNINDKYGHAAGDVVLRTVGERIKLLLREEDMVARIGGDEFAVAIANITNEEYIMKISQRIVDTVRKDYTDIQRHDSISVSIGIACFPGDGIDVDELINYADSAMYHVKEHGKNNYSNKIPKPERPSTRIL